MKSATTLRSKILQQWAIGAAIIGCIISGISTRGEISGAPASTESASESRVNGVTSSLGQDLASAFASRLLIVFTGVRQIGVPLSGSAVISNAGLTDFHDLSFSKIGGELSPDGSLIAYDSCSGANRGIYVATPDGGDARRIVALTSSQCGNLRWSRDGKKLSYFNQPDRSLHIVELATQHEEVVPNVEGAGWHWWSPTGEEIVYEQRTGKSGRMLYVTDLHGKIRQLTFAESFRPCEWQANLIDVWAPAWSPKGDWIAFTQCGSLFLISPNGKDLKQLTAEVHSSLTNGFPSAGAYNPRWSPDGRWIIFKGEVVTRVGATSPLKCISPDHKVILDIGKLPYGGGDFSIAPLKQ